MTFEETPIVHIVPPSSPETRAVAPDDSCGVDDLARDEGTAIHPQCPVEGRQGGELLLLPPRKCS